MPKIVGSLPPGSYLLDCSPIGRPKLLSVDPARLTPEQRRRICEGTSTFEVIIDAELTPMEDGSFKVTTRDQ